MIAFDILTENIVEKGENICFRHFLLIPQCLKSIFKGREKAGISSKELNMKSMYTERKKFRKFFTSLVFVYKSMSLKRLRIEQLCPSIDSMISLVFVHYAII